MKKNPIFVFAATVVLFSTPLAPAQQQQKATNITISLKDGRSMTVSTVRRDGTNVKVPIQLGTTAGEMGYPVASIASIDFPEPPEIDKAQDLLTRRKADEVVNMLSPVLEAQQPFSDLPGNLWQQVAQLKLTALVVSGRDADADELIKQLSQSSTDPDTLSLARVLRAASAVRKGDYELSLPVFEVAIKDSKNRETVVNAWLNKGHCHLGLKQWEQAILAYLRLPVFFSEQRILIPQAQLGAARAMSGLGDPASAAAKYGEIINSYPKSAEAGLAKNELEKLTQQTNEP
jgi:tetratricopeptide (TPR) repeat protein